MQEKNIKMNKPFSIHEWQAKQRQAKQRLLNEERSQESMSNTDIKALQKLAGEYSLNKILNTIAAIAGKMGKNDEADKVKKSASQIQDFEPNEPKPPSKAEIERMKQLYGPGFMDAGHLQAQGYFNPDDIGSRFRSRKDENVNEHHAGDYNPGFLKQSVSTFLDKLKKKTKEGKDYKTVEKIMEKHFSAKKKNEISTLGTGASFQAGSGEGYATPYAFKKKRK